MTAIEYLDTEVKKIVPEASGVSIGKWNDKSSWRCFVDSDKLTREQAEAVSAVFASFDRETFETLQVKPKTVEERLDDLETRMAVLDGKLR